MLIQCCFTLEDKLVSSTRLIQVNLEMLSRSVARKRGFTLVDKVKLEVKLSCQW